jgi:hypothetical protein
MSTATQADPVGQIKGAFAKNKLKWADGVAERHYEFLEDSVIFEDAHEVAPANVAARLNIYAAEFKKATDAGESDEFTAMTKALDAYIAGSKTQQGKKEKPNLTDPEWFPPADAESTEKKPASPQPAPSQPRNEPQPQRETPKPEIVEAAGSLYIDDDLEGENHDTDPAIRDNHVQNEIDLKALALPFAPSELSTDNNGHTYVTRKAVIKRLNQVVGIQNWQVIYEETDDLVKCGIGVYLNGAWVWKWDGAGKETEEEVKRRKSNFINAGKSWYSYAFRRAATMWGIGWYLLKK